MAEGTRRDQAVGPGVEGVPDVGASLAQRNLARHRDDREAAAFAGAVVLHDLAAQRLDQPVQVEVALGILLVAEAVLRAQDVAAVEGADPESAEGALDLLGEPVEAIVLDQDPEEVLVGEPLGVVGETLLGERLVDVRTVLGVAEALLTLGLRPLAGRADVHHRQPGLLGEREGTRVEGVGELLVVLGDHAGAAAIGAVELDELDAESLGDQAHRAVQLRGETTRYAAGPVGHLQVGDQEAPPGARPVSAPGRSAASSISSPGRIPPSGAVWSASSPRM